MKLEWKWDSGSSTHRARHNNCVFNVMVYAHGEAGLVVYPEGVDSWMQCHAHFLLEHDAIVFAQRLVDAMLGDKN